MTVYSKRMYSSSKSPAPIPTNPVEPSGRLDEGKVMRRTGWILALVLILLGTGLRLYDLKDPPLDFHATRQLRAALIARSMYYQMLPDADPKTRELAYGLSRTTGQYEPPIIEWLVATAYRIAGSEQLWLSRIFTSIFWAIGGLALYDLARRMTSSLAGLIGLSFYLFLPFAVLASRSFQPDPGMTMWLILAVYGLYRWGEKPGWKWAVVAGFCGGIAILTKAVAAYPIGGAAVALTLFPSRISTSNQASRVDLETGWTLGWRRAWQNGQVWSMAVLMLLPSLLYYLVRRPERASGYFTSWTLELIHLLLDPLFYYRWFHLLVELFGLVILILACVGVVLASGRSRSLLVGLWIGYLVYGLTLPYQMYTHNYYHLLLTPIIALCLAFAFQPLVDSVIKRSSPGQGKKIWLAVAAGALVVAIAFLSFSVIIQFNQEDFREAPVYWEQIAEKLPSDGKILGLTQDYGFPLAYYGWRKVILWPNVGERKLAELRKNDKEFNDFFSRRIKGKSYFLVTAMKQFDAQPDLKKYLTENYPIFSEGNGYLIFDLRKPVGDEQP